MSNRHHFEMAGLAASLAMAFMISAHAQTTTPAGTKSAATPAPSSATAPSSSAMSSSVKSAHGDLSRSDRKFIEKAAGGGIAEVELGKLAAEKAQDPQVKQFGQRMVDDHSKANDKLKQVASSKNVSLPTDMPKDAKREEDKLNKLSGGRFDKEYMSHMVSDHKKDVSEFRSASRSKDPEVKQFASETLPTLEQHLQMAQSIHKSK